MMAMTNRSVVFIAAVCAVWVNLHMLCEALDPGRAWYAQTAEWILGDAKGGIPVLHLAFPVLIAGTIASLCWKLPSISSLASYETISTSRHSTALPTFIHRWLHRLYNVEGDWNLDLWALSLLLSPSVVCVAMTIYRHMHGNELSLDDQLSVTSNSFGFVSEIMGSILLIPVAKQSSLLQIVGWSPARAVRLHIWAGRIFIIAVLVHGGMHIFRWMGLSNERLMTMIVPPGPCWTWDDQQYTSFEPTCEDEDTDCTCYAIFRNLTGFLGGVALLVLLVTSLHQVRRKFYRLFYVSHIIAAPIAIILVVLHWNRSILYMAPSLLYYVASSLPTFLERRLQSHSNGGVKIVALERLPTIICDMKKDTDNKASTYYISLTVEATALAVRHFRPGYYVQLLAPEISSISHPFTINAVPGKANQLRIIFKVLGKFSTELSHQTEQAISLQNTSSMPQLHLNGYVGTPNRVGEALRHDVAVMVAGGIGITPYLSLLHQLNGILSQSPPNTHPTKRIVLLWICRDASLVDYVKREYLQPLIEAQHGRSSDFKIKFVIYHTGNSTPLSPTFGDEENAVTNQFVIDSNDKDVLSAGVPFTPSRFSAGLSAHLSNNVLGFLAFSGIAWTGLAAVWWLYAHLQDTQHITTRLSGLVAIVGVGVVVAGLANLLARLPYFRSDNLDKDEAKSTPLLAARKDPDVVLRTNSIEMEGVPSLEDGFVTKSDFDDDIVEAKDSVILEEKQGRPSVFEMLKYVDNGRHPGLFTCGPMSMMQDIREHTEERCILRLQQCMGGATHNIALYEEAFTM